MQIKPKTNNPIKKWAKELNNTSQKKTSKWPTVTLKMLSVTDPRGHKPKPQGDITLLQLKWLLSQRKS
jgi:hypothetical protein